MNNIKAVIFDMDGVILDSESICDITWEMTRKEFGLPDGTDAINECRGTNRTDSCIILKRIFGQELDAEKFLDRSSEHFMEIEFSSGIPLMPYAKEILEYLKPKYRLALGGISAPKVGSQKKPMESKKPQAVEQFLDNHPEIQEIEICTDNDFAGRWACAHIKKMYSDRYRIIENLPEKDGADYGDLAKEAFVIAQEKKKDKAR